MLTQPTASHYINGQYVEDTNGKIIECIYPATGKVIATLHSATPEIIDMALDSAKNAQKAWAKLSGTERGRILRRASDIIRERNRELSILETYDTGKPMQETLYVDATSGADALEYFGGLAGAVTGEHIQLGEDWVYTKRIPLGVCVGIGAWNYPTQIACWKGAPALACGNTMVFKPSEMTPLCALKVAEILTEAGAPAGVYNVVQGYGDVGAALGLVGIRVPAPKVYETLASGAADAVAMPMESRKGFKLTEVAANVLEMPGGYYRGSFAFLMSQEKFDSLPADIQKALDENVFGEPASRMLGQKWDKVDAIGRQASIDAGNTITMASDADVAAYQPIAAAVTEKVLGELSAKGVDAQAAYDMIKAEMAK